VASETNRVKEFQRGTAGVPESVKEGATGLHEGSGIDLGSRDRAFESPHSDQSPQEHRSWGFFLVYCGAEFEGYRHINPSICLIFDILTEYSQKYRVLNEI